MTALDLAEALLGLGGFRVLDFEFLLAAGGRDEAIRVEGDGLGYANLLQLAVVLSTIPGPTETGPTEDDDEEDGGGAELDNQRTDDERQAEKCDTLTSVPESVVGVASRQGNRSSC